MGLADTEERRIDDGALRGIVTVTKVQPVDFDDYRRCKAAGEIITEEARGRFIYFAVRTERHVPFENASAHVLVTERFKAPLPHSP